MQCTFCSAVLARLSLAADRRVLRRQRQQQQQQQHRLRASSKHKHRCSPEAFRAGGSSPLQNPLHLAVLFGALEPSPHVAADKKNKSGGGMTQEYANACRQARPGRAAVTSAYQQQHWLPQLQPVGATQIIFTASVIDVMQAYVPFLTAPRCYIHVSSIIWPIAHHRSLGCLRWLSSFTRSNGCQDHEYRVHRMMC